MHNNLLRNSFVGLLLLAGSLVSLIFVSPRADALSGASFNAGNIINDSVFYNKTAMSPAQIQQFLNAKLPVCDTWGTQPYGGTTRANYAASKGVSTPFICLKNYSQAIPAVTNSGSDLCGGNISAGTKSAAQIIYDVAQACSVNPQVLLVLLQKEQSLVTDDWPWPIQYRSATGYGCPDTAPCDSEYYGFFNQVYQAAKAYKRYRANPANYNYRADRNNTILWNPNAACGTSQVWIENQATAGLYIYTPYRPNQAALNNLYGTGDSCSSYGNRNFWRMFNDWFGSTQVLAYSCDSKVQNVVCIWSLRKDDGSQFLTSSRAEMDYATTNFGWLYEGIAFYAADIAKTGSVPVYRLRKDNLHYYTANQTEYTTLKNTSGWVDEGIRFYVFPASASNTSHKIYKLYNSSTGNYYWVPDGSQKDSLLSSGYTVQTSVFNSFSGVISPPSVSAGRDNIYSLQNGIEYFYSSNLNEVESAITQLGYQYKGTLTTANASNSGTPIYRLSYGPAHFYTSNTAERDTAISQYGMIYEGVKFYVDAQSAQVYRLSNSTTGRYIYMSDLSQVMSVVNRGWKYETVLVNNTSSTVPVLRLYGAGEHFYTSNVDEAVSIANKSYKYEKIEFYANSTQTVTNTPVYRLYGAGAHFYTTSLDERNQAVSKYGFVYEGIKFYVSQGSTTIPIYRLYGAGEHFYTSNLDEKNQAVSKYGYVYEGIKFYAISP